MNRLARLFGRKPLLTPKQQQRLQHWRDLPAPDSDCRDGSIRCIVVDVESTGPDLSRDSLIAIGAVAVVDGGIAPNDAFAVTLRQARPSNTENILIHGIGAADHLDRGWRGRADLLHHRHADAAGPGRNGGGVSAARSTRRGDARWT